MNSKQLETILREYPPSRRLDVIVDGVTLQETTVLEVLIKLMTEAPETSSPVFMTFFGRDSCIIRERVEEMDMHGRQKKWLEIDLR